MTFLPIVERELRVAARRRRTYGTRLATAVMGLCLGAWILLVTRFQAQQTGSTLFVVLAGLAFVCATGAGLATTTDCLSEEKRDNTLGLLFLTDLKGYDVVFGKLAANSVTALYGLVAIFPILAIPLLAGGVSGAELGRVTLAVLTVMLASLSVGMFASAISRDERNAMGASVLLVALLWVGLPAAGMAISDWQNISVHPLYLIPSPGYLAFMAFDDFARSFPKYNFFYASVAWITGMSIILLTIACYILPRTWQDQGGSSLAARWRQWWQPLVYGGAASRARLRRHLLGLNPYTWLAGRDRLKHLLVWAFLVAVGLFWIWMSWIEPGSWKDESAYIITGLVWHTMLKLWLGVEATRRLVQDRRSGALELLLATPLTEREIIRGQLLALWRQFCGPVILIVLLDLTFLLAKANEKGWVLMWLGWIVVFLGDLFTLSWLGMWLSLSARNVNRAAGAALVRVMVVPWLIVIGLLTLIQVIGNFGVRLSSEDFIIGLIVLALGMDLLFFLQARQGLLTQFRDIATRKHETRRRWFGLSSASP